MSNTAQYAVRARELGTAAAAGLTQWYGTLPAGVAVVVGVAVSLQLAALLVALPGCLSGAAWLAAPFSQRWIHLILNILAFIPFAAQHERNMGTYPFLFMFLLLAFTTSAVHLVLAFFFGFVFSGLWIACTVGLSGIIFALISLEANKGELQTQELISLESKSQEPYFRGAQGYFERVFPGTAFFHRVESTPFLGVLINIPTFVPQPGGISLPTFNTYTASTPSSTATGYYQRSNYTGYGAVNGNTTSSNNQDRAALLNGGDV
ncbi:hypothetical protein HK100_004411 [Physocladia obscura]|uniref:Peptidase S54 rhomboid domain-containing protein n=1 Tax=Physocladia obscura TaxID=109957 RepID=A0AAD5SYK0_9FUNG|nr:hypothetical protein HK100_004411 [Physocladia obscura]